MRSRDLQIALVFNVEDGTTRGEPQDLIALQYTACTAQSLYETLNLLGYRTTKVPVEDSLEEFRRSLSAFSPQDTFVFNNCDGFDGENFGSVPVTQVIEDLGFSHTGSTPEVISMCVDKVRAKERMIAYGVPTPSFQVFTEPRGKVELKYPLFVKPMAEDASVGIDLKSVVTNEAELFARIRYLRSVYDQPALVEEFIPGRELTVSMWGNNGTVETLPITEEDFSQIEDPLMCILTYESKWVAGSPLYENILVRCPAVLPLSMEECVIRTAVQCYNAIGLRDFGRVDIRYYNGTPYVIDVNEIPDLAPDAGFARSTRNAGYSYPDMVEHLLDLALRREGWR